MLFLNLYFVQIISARPASAIVKNLSPIWNENQKFVFSGQLLEFDLNDTTSFLTRPIKTEPLTLTYHSCLGCNYA